ncbi:MAG: diheme cytochrome c [Gammaproteobacteria bacterium]|nr:diheme cytochrome c [Gammaproteobacteria bacterium]
MNIRQLVMIVFATILSSSVFAARDVAVVTDSLYKEECSACHMAYQPGLLPARSWEKMMANLADHFGENAELGEKERKAITDYAMKNAADFSNFKRSVKIMRSLSASDVPLRITDTPYIKRKHHELSNRHVKDNPKVKSLSRCDACHTKADTGSYSEREIKVPGFGRWED